MPSPEPWTGAVDVPLSLAAGLAFAILSAWVLAPQQMVADPVTESLDLPYFSINFPDYCAALADPLEREPRGYQEKRSRITALGAIALVPLLGVVDALGVWSLLATALFGSALFLWARITIGRAAGVAGAIAGLAISPLVLMPRMLSFYPHMAAIFTLAAAAVAALVWRPSLRAALLAGCGVGACALVDLRGVIWGGFFACAGLLGVLSIGRGRQRRWAIVAWITPIALAWIVGLFAYTAHSWTLERALDPRPRLWGVFELDHPSYAPDAEGDEFRYDSGFVWGRSPPWRWPETAVFLAHKAALRPPEEVWASGETDRLRTLTGRWQPLAIAAAVLVVLALARRPRTLVALALCLLPFALSYRGVMVTGQPHPRLLSNALPGLAVVLGLGIGVPVHWVANRLPPRFRARVLGPLVVATIGLLLVLGAVPNPLAPRAPWRIQTIVLGTHIEAIAGGDAPSLIERECQALLQRATPPGDPTLRSRLYPPLPPRSQIRIPPVQPIDERWR